MLSEATEQPNGIKASANHARLSEIDARLREIDAELSRDLPGFTAIANPKPLSVDATQFALSGDEALVVLFDTMEMRSLPAETLIWIVTQTSVRWVRSEIGGTALKHEVAALRCGLDAAAWSDDATEKCAELLKLPIDKAPKEGAPLPFDVARAHALYTKLFGDASKLIEGKHLLLVPSGALTTLPFQVLVTEPPSHNDVATARWLIRDHALTVLPSVTALTSLRAGRKTAAPKPMIGFANPLLDGDQSDSKEGAWHKQQARRARAVKGCSERAVEKTGALRAVRRSATPIQQAAGLADLSHLRMQTPLPETADEVCEVARSVGADLAALRIGARATETEVKRLSDAGDLAQYRILHFATHGFLAGQISGPFEPGLVLTPPTVATVRDDGYLSGSEIAGLKLNADWVILSACNTAGGAGQGEASETLSGLARVFFYAGARALLVSHWEVESHAAVKLVTGAIGELAKDNRIGRAKALQRAMLAVMADTTRPSTWVPAWHPSVWAPFVVVGEGGSAR